jgi:hypothetical protein
MLIQYKMKGSLMTHAGVIETTGFWLRFDIDADPDTGEVFGYKAWSHFGFTFEHKDYAEFMRRINCLLSVVSGDVDYCSHAHDCEVVLLKDGRRLRFALDAFVYDEEGERKKYVQD